MNAELRERLGRANYEARRRFINGEGVAILAPWEEQSERHRELTRVEAEAVVKELAAMLLPTLIPLLLSTEDFESVLNEAAKQEVWKQ